MVLAMIALAIIMVLSLWAAVAVVAQGWSPLDPGPARQTVTAADSATGGADAQSAALAVGAPTPLPPNAPTYHTVKTGETLGKIAAAYGMTTDAIASANGITNPNVIAVGQRLLIPAR
jgi:LysM repeat protein